MTLIERNYYNPMPLKRGIDQPLIDSFVSYIDGSEKTIDTYKKAIRQFYFYLQRAGITQPEREDVIRYRDVLSIDHKATTVQAYMIAVRQFFRWTASTGLYPNIAEHIKCKKISKDPKKDYLNTAAITAILEQINTDTLQGMRDYAVLVLMLTCGLRDIEVVRADVEDLRMIGDSTVLFVKGKGRDDKDEYIKVPEETEKAIRAYLKKRGAKEEQPLFTSLSNNSSGERLTTRSVSRIVKNAMRKAGYDSSRLTAHSLRHTAITLSLKAGESLQEVQQFARHSNINTTLIYAHNLEKEKNGCSNAIASAIFRKEEK